MSEQYDLIIVGAGPAGCTLALQMAETGLKIAILEKDHFPRKKICGDALSGKVMNVLKRLPDPVYHEFLQLKPKVPSMGIRFTAPDGKNLDLPFFIRDGNQHDAPGYICPREEFDHFLFKQLERFPNINTFEGVKVERTIANDKGVMVHTASGSFFSKMIAGADGINSKVRSLVHPQSIEKKHYCLGIRQYYRNIGNLHPENFIELIFLEELLPGYLWIFPGPEGISNVGIGMLQSQVSEKRLNMSGLFNKLITSHPLLEHRFHQAEPIGKTEAHRLPLGTLDIPKSGNRCLVIGDAAFLVDPFSGEGIGNAMASAEVASRILKQCFLQNTFTSEFLKTYDRNIERRIGHEMKVNAIIQRLAHSPGLINFVVGKARKNKLVSELLREMYTNADAKKKLTRPGFYLGLLWR